MLPRRDDWDISPSVHSDLNLARNTRANLLLVGTERLVAHLVSALVPDLNPGLTIRRRDGRLVLPPPSSQTGTVVVRDVDTLTHDEQGRLLEWLGSAKTRTQVLSTASAPVLSLVETRAFNDALYYRLNTVYIDLSE